MKLFWLILAFTFFSNLAAMDQQDQLVYIHLNDGSVFYQYKSTLVMHSKYLENYFSGKFQTPPLTQDKNYHINLPFDKNGMKVVMDFFTYNKLYPVANKTSMEKALKIAEFLQVEKLLNAFSQKSTKTKNILHLTPKEINLYLLQILEPIKTKFVGFRYKKERTVAFKLFSENQPILRLYTDWVENSSYKHTYVDINPQTGACLHPQNYLHDFYSAHALRTEIYGYIRKWLKKYLKDNPQLIKKVKINHINLSSDTLD